MTNAERRGNPMVLKGIKIKLYPTEKQKIFIDRNLALNRFVWNQLLAMQGARHENGGRYVGKYAMHNLMKPLKWEFPFLKEADSTSLEYTSDDLDAAFQRFFNKQNGYPRFKSRKRPKSTYTTKCINNSITVVDNHYIQMPKLKLVKCHGAHRITGRIMRATIRKEPDGSYTATILVEEAVPILPKTGAIVGLDMGITHLVIQSDGYKLKNKQFERALAKQKRIWQRKFARRRERALREIAAAKANGVELQLTDFKNLQKAKQQVARINKRIKNQRLNYLHHYTTQLVKEHDIIVMEDLKTKNLMKNHHLARSIADASWGIIKNLLTYKCAWHKKELILVKPHYTSQTCSHCGMNTGKKPLHIRMFNCPHCHAVGIDRDINAAVNIRNKAFA